MYKRILFCLCAMLLTTTGVFAGVPDLMNHQGVLLSSSGDPVTTPASVVFTIYDDSTGGNPIWTNQRTLSPDAQGVFSIILGETVPIDDSVFTAPDRYLGIAVNGDPEMTPRMRLVSVPFSFLANRVSGDIQTSRGLLVMTDAAGDTTVKIDSLGNAHFVGAVKSGTNTLTLDGPNNQLVTDYGQMYFGRVPGNFWDVQVGIGTKSPSSALHVDNPISSNGGSAVRVDFRNSVGSIGTRGITAESDVLADKGGQIAVLGKTSISPVNHGQEGASEGRLSQVAGFSAYGDVTGVMGYSNPLSLDNTTGYSSFGLGGRFDANASSPLNLDATGTYYVGGAYGRVRGEVNNTSGNAIVAGIIGLDENTGTAPSFAGYFDGDGYFSGDVGIGTTTPNEQLEITGNLRLPQSTASAGVIKLGAVPFIHGFGSSNTFIGSYAGNLTMSGSKNTASGTLALFTNTTGDNNTACGSGSLVENATGSGNTASGTDALAHATGNNNTATGYYALGEHETGNNNTACGAHSLVSNYEGSNNTAIGYNADVGPSATMTNATAIGANAYVDASNKIRLGDDNVTVIEGQVAYTFTSDKNQKENFRPVDGDAVLRKLRELDLTSWNYKGQDPQRFRHYGPVAQEFFAAFGHDGLGTSGTPTTINTGDMAGILMIAVQTLNQQNQGLQQQNQDLTARLAELEKLVHRLAEEQR